MTSARSPELSGRTVPGTSPTVPARRPPGLRERKKTKTREAIRAATYGLIEEQGWESTTVEQIADRAEVSASTVFRYFPTKEDIVLTDAYDALIPDALRARPADEPWPQSLRYVVHRAVRVGVEDDPEVARLRARLVAEVPAVRSRMKESMAATGRMLCRAVGERTGLDPGSLEVRVWAMSLIGGLVEVSLYWAENGSRDDISALVDRALDVVAHGLPAART